MHTLDGPAALAILARAQAHQVAAVVDGAPLLRTLHGVVLDGQIAFHGGRRGEKSALAGAEVVVSAEEIVARIPSFMVHPEKACPATTYFRSAQARGRLVEVTDPARKAAMFAALMAHLQPEGGYRPLDPTDPLYTRSIQATRVLAMTPTALVGREKLGQNKSTTIRRGIVQGLWARGLPGDLAAIEDILATNGDGPLFQTPAGTAVCVAPGEAEVAGAVALVAGEYWNRGRSWSAAQLAAAHRGADAWIVLKQDGVVVATARAISDGGKFSWIYDVAVDARLRGAGVGEAMVRILLDHPAVRGTVSFLRTRDAQGFYAKVGFIPRPTCPFGSEELVRPLTAAAR